MLTAAVGTVTQQQRVPLRACESLKLFQWPWTVWWFPWSDLFIFLSFAVVPGTISVFCLNSGCCNKNTIDWMRRPGYQHDQILDEVTCFTGVQKILHLVVFL